VDVVVDEAWDEEVARGVDGRGDVSIVSDYNAFVEDYCRGWCETRSVEDANVRDCRFTLRYRGITAYGCRRGVILGRDMVA
jgi:hypothetical protein